MTEECASYEVELAPLAKRLAWLRDDLPHLGERARAQAIESFVTVDVVHRARVAHAAPEPKETLEECLLAAATYLAKARAIIAKDAPKLETPGLGES